MYSWDPHQVALWLRDLDPNLEESAQLLEDNGVNGEQLVGMGTNDFVSMGVPYGHAYYIYNQVRIFIASESDSATTTTLAIARNETKSDSEDDGLFSFVDNISLADMLIVFVCLIICIVCCMCVVFCLLMRSREQTSQVLIEDPELQQEIDSIERHFRFLFCQSLPDASLEDEFYESLSELKISEDIGENLFRAITLDDRIRSVQFIDFMYDFDGHEEFKQLFLNDMSKDQIIPVECNQNLNDDIIHPSEQSSTSATKIIEPGDSLDESGDKRSETDSNISEKEPSEDSNKPDPSKEAKV